MQYYSDMVYKMYNMKMGEKQNQLIKNVVANVQIPEWEERRPPRQCNWQKGEVYY